MRHYAFNVGDYAAATAHLSDAEDLAYRRLLDAYYAREGPLPTEERACCRLARATKAEARAAVGVVLREFFVLRDDGWHQVRCDDEIARFRERSEKARASGRLSGESRRTIAERTFNERSTNAPTDAELPITHNPNATLPCREAPLQEGAIAPLSGDGAPDVPKRKPPGKVNGHPKGAAGLQTTAREILGFLNEKAARRFPPTDSNVGIVVARLREGFTPSQLRQVIANRVRKWAGDERMAEYLRPDTLFNRSKFSNYVGELVEVPDVETPEPPPSDAPPPDAPPAPPSDPDREEAR